MIEREFKYLAAFRGDAPSGVKVIQQYPADGVRIRKVIGEETRYFLTVKMNRQTHAGQPLTCVEIEKPLTEEEFNQAWREDAPTIEKTRYSHQGRYHWDIDDFGDFIMAECEVPDGVSTGEAVRDCPPYLLLYSDVTDDVRYTNFNIARERCY